MSSQKLIDALKEAGFECEPHTIEITPEMKQRNEEVNKFLENKRKLEERSHNINMIFD